MITAIRKQFKTAGYRTMLWFITIAIVAGMILIPALLRKTVTGGPWAIRVNKQEISYQLFMQEVTEQRDRIAAFRAQYGQFADMFLQSMGVSLDPKALAFDVLVKEELLGQLAQDIGLYLHTDYIAKKINDVQFVQQHLANLIPPYLFDNGVLNRQALRRYLQLRAVSMRAFEHKVEQVLARVQIMNIIQSAFYVPTFDVKQRYIA